MFVIFRPVLGLVLLVVANGAIAMESLTLAEALHNAQRRDPVLAQLEAQTEAARATAVAAGAWPDPQISLGAMNVPTDSFAFNQDMMTMLTLGVRQAIPAGDSAQFAELRGQRQADALNAAIMVRKLELERELRELWYQIASVEQTLALARESEAAFQRLVKILTAQYANGAVSQQALLRAQVRLGGFVEQAASLAAEQIGLRGALARWIGEEQAALPFAKDITLPAPPARAQLLAGLPSHPALQVQDALIAARRADERIAEEAYGPSYMVELQYGYRQGVEPMSNIPRGDMASLMFTFSLPVFTDDLQDRQLSAAQANTRAARHARENQLRILHAQLQSSLAQWVRYGELEELYATQLIPAAITRVATAQAAYENGTGDLDTLIEAQLGAFETRSNAAEMTRERAGAQATLLYLAGDHHE